MASRSGRRCAAAAAPWVSLLKTALKKNGGSPGARFCQLATVGVDGGPRVRTIVYRGTYEGEQEKQASRGRERAGEASVGKDQAAMTSTASAPALMFVTDARSHKVTEASTDPRAEVAWYLTHTREQFRFRGRLVLVTAETGKREGGDTLAAAEGEQGDADSAAPASPANESESDVMGPGWLPSQLQALRARVWSELSDKTRAQMHWPQPGRARDPSQPSSLWQAPPEDIDVSASSAIPDTFVLVLLRVEHVDNLHLRTNRRFTHDLVAPVDDGVADRTSGPAWVQREVNP